MIQQPSAIAKKEKKIRLLIGGYPGIGKSTVALSAPNPLHIDVDRGIDRVPAPFRKPFIQSATYEELKDDLVPETVKDFDTLVFDTGGQLIKLMSGWAIRQNPAHGQKDGSLSLKGYGAVGREFERLMNYCYYELNKHIVVLFHAKEDKDGDNTRLRLLVEGQTKDNVWQPMDLGGFMEMNGNTRTLGLTNCERYYAKGTHGIKGILPIPELNPGVANDFLSRLFTKVNENIAAESVEADAAKDEYDRLMADMHQLISGITTLEEANAVIPEMKKIKHVLTSQKEIRSMFAKRVKELGFIQDKQGVHPCNT